MPYIAIKGFPKDDAHHARQPRCCYVISAHTAPAGCGARPAPRARALLRE